MDNKILAPRNRINRTPIWRTARVFLTYLMLFIGVIIALFPFFWMISTSLMSLGEAQGTRLIPSSVHFENYTNAWKEAKFSLYMVNSVKITLITLAGELTFSILAAYAFARIKFPGRDLIFTALLSTMMIPAMDGMRLLMLHCPKMAFITFQLVHLPFGRHQQSALMRFMSIS